MELSEGKEIIQDNIFFLKKQKPLGSLTFSEELSLAAQLKLNELIVKIKDGNEIVGNASELDDRISKFVEWENKCSESICIGLDCAKDIVISMLLDDGVTNRDNKSNIFEESFNYIGIGVLNESIFGIIVSIIFVGNIRKKGKSHFNKENFKYDFPKRSISIENTSVNLKKKKLIISSRDLTKSIDSKRSVSSSQEIGKIKTSLALKDEDAPIESKLCITKNEIKLNEENNKCYKVTKRKYFVDRGKENQFCHVIESEIINLNK